MEKGDVQLICAALLTVVAFIMVTEDHNIGAAMVLVFASVVAGLMGAVLGDLVASMLGCSVPFVFVYFVLHGNVLAAISAVWIYTVPALFVIAIFWRDTSRDKPSRPRIVQVELVNNKKHKYRRRRRRY